MAAYQTMTLTNLPSECGIQIACVKTGDLPGTITKVKLKRRIHGTIPYVTIWEKAITTVDDFSFTVKDFNTKSRYTYDYMAMPCEGDNETIGITGEIKCDFADIYISDTTATYICKLNAKSTGLTRNRSYSKVETLGSKYPFIIRNGLTNYMSGTITGLFLPVPTSGNYTQEATQTAEARDYKDAALDFLDNGISKTIKTFDGHMWYAVTVEAKELDGEADGASEITFNWMEIGAPLSTGVVVST